MVWYTDQEDKDVEYDGVEEDDGACQLVAHYEATLHSIDAHSMVYRHIHTMLHRHTENSQSSAVIFYTLHVISEMISQPLSWLASHLTGALSTNYLTDIKRSNTRRPDSSVEGNHATDKTQPETTERLSHWPCPE